MPGAKEFQPLLARTRTFHRPVGPATYDCVKLITVRDGSALVYSEFGEKYAKVGDVLLLGANVLCGAQPEGHVTVTVIYLDLDFILDQFFWQYIDLVKDRFASQSVADTIYTEPAQLMRLGEDRAGMLMPWLDELVSLSVDGQYRERFHRMQALWHFVIDQVSPFIHVSPTRTSRVSGHAPGRRSLVGDGSRHCAPRLVWPVTCCTRTSATRGPYRSWRMRCTCLRRNSSASSLMPMGRPRWRRV